ncbi:MiaB/RimO family radical SAM methylthiotransferase [Lancefieldella sp. Marseille-Q7238]|uniref:MiaB/RimO family radical SAM methylthiotransferase n=1 Tax=Lancefieldella sp. Marseille-Q7238 TaxID=3022127 RepID=UPI0024A7CBAB|nr:MiaB/RimO family radical SAM methylthiotransferase [Lancefieldella sp. Marseille-Q7238]
MANKRIALLNLGCRVNRVELDLMADELIRMGCSIVDQEDASAIIINTCAVTAEAEAKTRKAVRHAASLPQAPLVVATGCVANLFADELASLAPNVVVEVQKDRVAEVVMQELGCALEGVSDEGYLLRKATPTGRTRPGIKIQDGCDNRCTFCIVWKARGPARSLAPDEVIKQIRAAQSHGAQEVVLTGINLGSYRVALGEKTVRLPELLDLILQTTTIGRVRISSLEPPDVDEELLAVMASSNGRVAPFLHLCLQSGCDETLRRMGRMYQTELYRFAVEAVREKIPHVSLGTDLIVGFPGETEEEFEISRAFCEEMNFSKMHVFRYSKRPGTPAAQALGQVSPQVMAARAHTMRELAFQMRYQSARGLVGTTDSVVVQTPGKAVSGGLFDVSLDPGVPVDSLISVRFESVSKDATLKASLVSV